MNESVMDDFNVSTMAPTTSDGKTHLESQLYFVMDGIICPIFCLAGMIGNILSLAIWTRPKMKSSTARYLTGQAVADFVVLFLFIFCDSIKVWAPHILHSVHYAIFFSYVAYPIYYLAVICSIWLTVGVTVDRFIMVCWISKSKQLCTESMAKYGLIMIFACSFVVNLPHFFYYKPSPATLVPDKALTKTEFINGNGGRFYDFWVNCISLKVVPWFAVLFMNSKIIMTINSSNQLMADKTNRRSMNKRKKAENQITRLLLAVTFSFIFFIGIHCIVQAIVVQEPTNVNMDRVREAYAVARSLIILNSALNFVFYCLSGKRFRKELRNMLGLRPRDSGLSKLLDSSATSNTSSTRSTSATGM